MSVAAATLASSSSSSVVLNVSVLKIDTGLAEKSLESLDVNTGCFVPHNLQDKVFTHFTADNIDINDSTLHPVFTSSDSSDFSASPVSILSTSW
jgi:hypothetical protein